MSESKATHPDEENIPAENQTPVGRALAYIGIDLGGPSPSTLLEKLIALLYIFVPLAFLVEFLHIGGIWVFVVSALAIIPLAKLLGTATEELAARSGPAVGGLLNATFGNATELIISFFALQAGLTEIVKASITGSIIGNILFVLGLSIFLGGLRRDKQNFNQLAASANASQMALAAIGLVIPAVFVITSPLLRNGTEENLNNNVLVESLSVAVAIVLLIAYVGQLIFSLVTHRKLYEDDEQVTMHGHVWSVRHSVIVLLVATAIIGFIAEFLVEGLEYLTTSVGMSELFVGVILVAIIGNAAEHLSAVSAAIKDKMDLSLNIAVGSTLQIALFVAPVLVLLGFFTAHQMSIIFSTFELAAIIGAVFLANLITQDGETHWFEGLQLMIVYTILAIGFFFHP